ncbi:glycosyltransferase family 4 protein [Nakamurella aerolata]|uniref:Glycosyltransferase family 4 protein n=1 Tax=Nakamurella aerolata TaxID=1656892 RepID=A0A849AAY1_9ACTN|nr:glycosyltransferase family 1 protein [Nakamurella aerolata]NNG36291.1 glycosyltransferase family 4 protein [Nakamurella aerolata]
MSSPVEPAELSVRLDATPLLGQRTGIGRYTEQLIAGLAALAPRERLRVGATAFTLRGAGQLAAALPPGVSARSLPVPARGLRTAWTYTNLPPVSLLAGRSEVFHGTNFVLPPTGRSAGVVTIHDLAYLVLPDTVDATSRALRELVPISLRRAAMVVVPSLATAAAVQDAYRVPDDKLAVTPLGVDGRWLAATPAAAGELRRWGLPERFVLFVGTREPRKDLRTLLAAHAAAEHADPDTPPLVLIGQDGWGDELRPASSVLLAGYQPQARLPGIVAAAQALVMPSRYEGFGIPAIEALATGTRTVVSDLPVLAEVTGGHADVFGVGDADALAELLITTKDQAPQQVRDARREWAARWRWEMTASSTLAAYRRAAGRD